MQEEHVRAGERRAAIERELSISGRVSVASLARALSASPISIRRDLNTLVDRGVAKRVHGGAVAIGAAPGARTPIVQRARTQRSDPGMIGLVVPSSRYYYTGVLEGVKAAAAEASARVVLAVSGYSGEQERMQIRRLVERGVDGLVVTPAETASREPATYEMLRDLLLPVVLMERDGGDEFASLDSVRSDHVFGARIAFQKLADVGHRAVALVCAQGTATAGWLYAGFEAKRDLFAPGRAERIDIVSAPEYSPELREQIDQVLDRFIELGITGALVHSDVAAGVLAQRASERGIAVSAELEIIAYDDEVAALADPPLDAVAPRKHEVGRLALKLVLERAAENGTEIVPRHIVLPPSLVLRARALEGRAAGERPPK